MVTFIWVVSLLSLLAVVLGFYWIGRDHEKKMAEIYKRHQEAMGLVYERHSKTMDAIFANYKGKS